MPCAAIKHHFLTAPLDWGGFPVDAQCIEFDVVLQAAVSFQEILSPAVRFEEALAPAVEGEVTIKGKRK